MNEEKHKLKQLFLTRVRCHFLQHGEEQDAEFKCGRQSLLHKSQCCLFSKTCNFQLKPLAIITECFTQIFSTTPMPLYLSINVYKFFITLYEQFKLNLDSSSCTK